MGTAAAAYDARGGGGGYGAAGPGGYAPRASYAESGHRGGGVPGASTSTTIALEPRAGGERYADDEHDFEHGGKYDIDQRAAEAAAAISHARHEGSDALSADARAAAAAAAISHERRQHSRSPPADGTRYGSHENGGLGERAEGEYRLGARVTGAIAMMDGARDARYDAPLDTAPAARGHDDNGGYREEYYAGRDYDHSDARRTHTTTSPTQSSSSGYEQREHFARSETRAAAPRGASPSAAKDAMLTAGGASPHSFSSRVDAPRILRGATPSSPTLGLGLRSPRAP